MKVKFLRVQIQDKLHERLKALIDHHGDLSHHVRIAVREYVTRKEAEHADRSRDREVTKLET